MLFLSTRLLKRIINLRDDTNLALSNDGDLIDNNKLNSIFTSLTSYRTKSTQGVHLGLGLYISSLICEFHNAQLKAVNNEHNQSVSFILSIPVD
ncbi:MAG: hypothetical protein KAI22_09670 [Gammaproteobacteria bacterium]|nr:hypothetical protein [Gammaproteobacteria bacterium]